MSRPGPAGGPPALAASGCSRTIGATAGLGLSFHPWLSAHADRTVEAVAHRKVYRPWGWYDSIDMGERFRVKRLFVKAGASLSLQMPHHRAERWI